jgi:hypothetical protein
MVDLEAMIKKLTKSCQKMGTFGRGDPDPKDEWVIVLTGEEKSYLELMLETALELQKFSRRA